MTDFLKLPFNVGDFLDRFDRGNIFNAQDMILILRDEDTGTSHIIADILEGQEDALNECKRN